MNNGKPSTLKTFNPAETLQQIRDEVIQVIMVPFYGTMVPVQVRLLTDAQITACGSISLIETFEDKIRQKNKRLDMREILAYSERMHRIVEEALVAPTYKQIMEQFAHAPKLLDAKQELDKLKKKLRSEPNRMERKALEQEIDSMKLWVNYILPEDFIATIVSFVLDIDRSDIKKVTRDILLECAYLAERGHDNPHEHCQGRFTPFMQKDFDRRAWAALDEERKKK